MHLSSLKTLKMKRVTNIFNTKEKVEQIRQKLNQATEDSFKEFAAAKRKAWHEAKNIVLD